MTETTNSGIELVDPSQANKALRVNAALATIEKCLTHKYTKDLTGLTTWTLPYSATEGADKSGLQNMYMKFTGTPSAGVTITHPTKEHVFIVNNACGHTLTFDCGGVTQTVANGAVKLLFCDGTDIVQLT